MAHRFPVEHPFHAVEDEVTVWAAGLGEIAERLRERFTRAEPRMRTLAYIRGLLSPVERKNGWQLAEESGESSPDNFQHLLNRAEWDAGRVRDELQDYVIDHLGDDDAVLAIDETGFIKKGEKSAGVARQYCGTAGKVENCQVGVFMAYVSPQGRALIDRALYLPKQWLDEPQRRSQAGIPEEAEFLTKPQLAQRMLARAHAAELPFRWVVADEVYGRDGRLRMWLESKQIAYVLAIASSDALWKGFSQPRVKALVAAIPEDDWQRVSAGDGAKGPRMYDWGLVPLNSPPINGWRRWLLVRRSLGENREMAYYLACAPAETPLVELVRVAGSRWAIEECFESAKGEVGLDQYEVRLWKAWYRHITLAMFAHAFLSVCRAEARLEAVAKGGTSSKKGTMIEFKRRRGLACP